jgi:hypothetical protein
MSRAIWVFIGICLLSGVVYASVTLIGAHERDGRSPYEKMEDGSR